eukprot:2532290-Rhodomonas_salina.1
MSAEIAWARNYEGENELRFRHVTHSSPFASPGRANLNAKNIAQSRTACAKRMQASQSILRASR